MAKASSVSTSSFFTKNKLLVALLGIVFLVFANTLLNDYSMDDEIVTIHHPLTSKGISAIPEILKSPYFKADIYSYEYRPVVHISFAIEHQFFGESAGMSHFVNLVLYLILIAVSFSLLKQLFPLANEYILGVVTLLFALHPTHTEVVASIKNRDEIFALLFTFLAFKEAIKFSLTKQWWRIFTMLLLFNLAMGSKVTVLPFVVVIPLSVIVLLKQQHNVKPLLVTLGLALFAAFWIETFSFLQQLYLVFGSLFLVAAFYYIAIYEYGKKVVTELKKETTASKEIPLETEPRYFIGNFTSLAQVVLKYKWWLLVIAVLNIAVLVFGALVWSLLALMALMILLIAFSKSEEFRKLIVLLFIVLSFEIYLLSSTNRDSFWLNIGILYAGLVWNLRLIHPAILIPFLIPTLLKGKYGYAFALPIFSLAFFWAESTVKYRRIISYSIIAIAVGLLLPSVFTADAVEIPPQIALAFLFVALVFFSPITKQISTWRYVTVFFTIVVIATQFTFIRENYKSIFNTNYSRNTQQVVSKTAAPKIVPTASYRPVEFAEYPIAEYPKPFDKRLSLSASALLKYLKLTVLPYPLAFYYGYKEIEVLPLTSFPVILSFLLHLALVGAAIYYFKRSIFIAFGIGFYLITISPFSTLFYPIPGVIADRYLFAPTLGWAFVVVGIFTLVFKVNLNEKSLDFSNFQPKLKYGLGAILVCYSLISIARNSDWKDKLTLFETDIKHVDNSAQAHNLLAFKLSQTAQTIPNLQERNVMLEKAVYHFRRAVEIWPDFLNATYDMGRNLEQLGRLNEAVAAYKSAFKIDSTFSDALFRAGICYEGLSNMDSAAICYEKVVQVNPSNVTAFNNLSFLYFKDKNYNKAVEVSRKAYTLNPTNTDPLVNIGKIYININQGDSALYYFEKAYPLRANDSGLAQILYQMWNEKGNTQKSDFYLSELRKMGAVR